MSKVAFVFPGQGSQAVGMGVRLMEECVEARAVVYAADDALSGKLDLISLLSDGPRESLDRTANTQPAILTVSLAAHAALLARLPGLRPTLVAGHSLGEYSALVAAGALSLPDALRAVRARGTFMQQAVPEGFGAMAAIVGLGAEQVEAVCARVSSEEGGVVEPANINGPRQTVISGEAGAVAVACKLLKQNGARRVVQLPVSAPFHCSLMAPVKTPLEAILEEVDIRAPKVPVISNVDATPVRSPRRVKSLLVKQVVSPVLWEQTIRAFAAAGVTDVVELGPGKVLCGLVRRIEPTINCHNVEDPDGLGEVVSALGGDGGGRNV